MTMVIPSALFGDGLEHLSGGVPSPFRRPAPDLRQRVPVWPAPRNARWPVDTAVSSLGGSSCWCVCRLATPTCMGNAVDVVPHHGSVTSGEIASQVSVTRIAFPVVLARRWRHQVQSSCWMVSIRCCGMPACSAARMMRALCSAGAGVFCNSTSLGRYPIAMATCFIVVGEIFPAA